MDSIIAKKRQESGVPTVSEVDQIRAAATSALEKYLSLPMSTAKAACQANIAPNLSLIINLCVSAQEGVTAECRARLAEMKERHARNLEEVLASEEDWRRRAGDGQPAAGDWRRTNRDGRPAADARRPTTNDRRQATGGGRPTTDG